MIVSTYVWNAFWLGCRGAAMHGSSPDLANSAVGALEMAIAGICVTMAIARGERLMALVSAKA